LTFCQATQALWTSYPFPIGGALDPTELPPGSEYQRLTRLHFNSVTPENIFKPSFLHPAPTQYDWTQADLLVAFCQTNQQRLHGHTLIWHQQLPG
jgi:endo-1,4-beta-xylanase